METGHTKTWMCLLKILNCTLKMIKAVNKNFSIFFQYNSGPQSLQRQTSGKHVQNADLRPLLQTVLPESFFFPSVCRPLGFIIVLILSFSQFYGDVIDV